MADFSGVYEAHMLNIAVTGAITLVQVKAGADTSLVILRAWMSQENIDTTDQLRVQFVIKSAAATVTTFTPLLHRRNTGAAKAVGGTAATGTNATVEGTDTDILNPDVPNQLNGWLYMPVPEERIIIAGGDIIGLKLPAAPAASTNITAGIVFGEY